MKNKTNCDDNFCINTNNGPITPKSVIKYLGVFIDHKSTWKNHIQYAEEKLCRARGILSTLRYYAPLSVLRSVYFDIAYPHLHHGITSWGDSASKYISKVQVQQNLILKIMTKTFFKTRFSPIYRQLNFLNLGSIFELEVIKFVYKFKKRTPSILFYNYFWSASQTHSYPTRFALDVNWTVMPCKKTSTQRSICYEGYKIWNKLPIEVKSNYRLTFNNFCKKIKTYLRSKQF